MRLRYTLFLMLFLAGCGIGGGKGPTASTKKSSSWDITFSPGMPKHPTPSGAGWYFDFPSDPKYPSCVSDSSCNLVSYVLEPYSGSAVHQVSMTLRIETTGSPIFNGQLEPGNTCSAPASVRFLVQRRNDDFGTDYYRWWSNPGNVVLTQTGDVTLTVPFTPDMWSGLFGEFANSSPQAQAGFQAALNDLGHVGMTFGGGCFFGHGVNISNGTARFVLVDFSIS